MKIAVYRKIKTTLKVGQQSNMACTMKIIRNVALLLAVMTSLDLAVFGQSLSCSSDLTKDHMPMCLPDTYDKHVLPPKKVVLNITNLDFSILHG